MKKLLLALGILALVCSSPAMAARNAGGAILLHTNDAATYSTGWDYCGDNTPSRPLPQTCEELATQSNVPIDVISMVWAVAAFAPGASPSVTAYQFGIYGDLPADQYTDKKACPITGLEVPDATWPGPGSGTAVGFTAGPITSHLFKIYWFATQPLAVGDHMRTGNYPGGDGHAEFADDSAPPQIDFVNLFGSVGWGAPGEVNCPGNTPLPGACCFRDGHCEVLPDANTCVAAGGTFQGPGTVCDPNTCPQPTGACCVGTVCSVMTAAECAAAGGVYQGDDVPCTDQTCFAAPTGACCVGTVCSIMTADGCAAVGGTYQGDNVPCTDTTCAQPPATGACCIGQDCTIQTEADCLAANGTYKGDNVPCNTDTCIPVPTKSTTWGQIKGQYR